MASRNNQTGGKQRKVATNRRKPASGISGINNAAGIIGNATSGDASASEPLSNILDGNGNGSGDGSGRTGRTGRNGIDNSGNSASGHDASNTGNVTGETEAELVQDVDSGQAKKPRRQYTKRVKEKDVFGEADMSSPEKFAKSMSPEIIAFIFALPVMAGLGEHWALEDEEASELSKTSWLCIASLPKAKRKQTEEAIARYAPLLMMILSLVTILTPRVMKTLDDRKSAKAKGKLLHIAERRETTDVNSEQTTSPRDWAGKPSAERNPETASGVLSSIVPGNAIANS